jgi:hypothetical protein
VLDPASGELVLPSAGVRLGPTWTRTRFLASELGARAMPLVTNEPWASYRLALTPGEVGPFPASVALFFHGESLRWISIMDLSPAFGTSWSDLSEEKELLRKSAHDHWLAASGAPPGQHPWARVWSEYEPRSGYSSIAIRYDQAIGAD